MFKSHRLRGADGGWLWDESSLKKAYSLPPWLKKEWCAFLIPREFAIGGTVRGSRICT